MADGLVHCVEKGGWYPTVKMLNSIQGYKIFKHVTDQNTLEIPIENMKKMDTEHNSELKSVMSFLLLLQEESNEYLNLIKFI